MCGGSEHTCLVTSHCMASNRPDWGFSNPQHKPREEQQGQEAGPQHRSDRQPQRETKAEGRGW